MFADHSFRPILVFAISLTVLGLMAATPARAQDEPTPTPAPVQEEPAVEPTAPEPASEPAEAEPVAESAPAAEPAPAAQTEPTAEPEPEVAAIPVVYRPKTVLTLNGKAQANGVLELVVQPQGEEPTKIRVNVVAKTNAKKITNDVIKELAFALGDRYKVNRSGDRKVAVKAKKKTVPPLAITLKTQTLQGVTLLISKG